MRWSILASVCQSIDQSVKQITSSYNHFIIMRTHRWPFGPCFYSCPDQTSNLHHYHHPDFIPVGNTKPVSERPENHEHGPARAVPLKGKWTVSIHQCARLTSTCHSTRGRNFGDDSCMDPSLSNCVSFLERTPRGATMNPLVIFSLFST